MMQITTRSQGKEQQGELFRLQRQEKALREVDPRPKDTLGMKPLVSLEIIYKNIQEKVKRPQKKAEQWPTFFPDYRILSAFDAESGQFRMSMLDSTKPKGEPISSATNYKATKLTIDA